VNPTRKLQVFVSSTYVDLRSERQTAVAAILEAGHIPAGMELFAAGDEEQLHVIRRWIDESDIFLLILGRRYGSLEPATKKSYTQLEYEYAKQAGKPFFAIVLSDTFVTNKVRSGDSFDAIRERESPEKFETFYQLVTSRLCKFPDDHKDIRLAIGQSIAELQKRHEFAGWVSARVVAGDLAPIPPNTSAQILDSAVPASLDAPFDESEPMRESRGRASLLARSDLTIVVEGESGTGRRTLAQALAHQRSTQSRKPILIVDGMQGIAETFRAVLRESAGMSAEVIVYHLEVLAERQQAELADLAHAKKIRLVAVRRVEPEPLDFDSSGLLVRATPIKPELEATRITLPPLRERGADIKSWAEFLLYRAAARLDTPPPNLGVGALSAVVQHRWPGNLIELEAVLNRALCLTTSLELSADDLGLPGDQKSISPLKQAVEEFQASYIDRALAHFSGNRTQAARALGVDPRTIFRHLEQRRR
jgi:transcriptional regulator with PAS, ATPase and Fis domain